MISASSLRWQSEDEARSAAGARLRPDGAAMKLDEPACNREAEARTATVGACARVVGLPESVEDVLRAVARQADSGVLDRDVDPACARLDDDGHRTVAGGVPQRVRQKIHEHALDLVRSR